VEWFKSSKQRDAVAPKDHEVPAEPDTRSLAAQLAAMPTAKLPSMIASPKARFDNPAVLPAVLDEPRPVARTAPPIRPAFRISSSKDGQTGEFDLTSPTLTVAKARMLFKSGWRVHITNAAGRQFAPSEFDEVLKFD
jgi:hypothetical protein